MHYYGNDPLIERTGKQYNIYGDAVQIKPPKPRKNRRAGIVKKIAADGTVIRTYPSVKALAELEGISIYTVYDRICRKRVIDGCTFEIEK